MYHFNYHKPATTAEAEQLFSSCDDPVFLAGGHTLLPAMKQRLQAPSDVIDIGGIAELTGITVTADTVRIGAYTTHGAVAGSAEVATAIPALAALAAGIGDQAVRNRGTIAGSIANNDPAADYPAAVLGLGATIETTRRQIDADGFFEGMFETALVDGELITGVSFPIPVRAGYGKFPNPASRYATVGVFVADTPTGIRVAITGAKACVYREPALEAALSVSLTAAALDGITIDTAHMNTDLHASAEYRANLVAVMARRVVEAL